LDQTQVFNPIRRHNNKKKMLAYKSQVAAQYIADTDDS
jgi:hypothetical protein